MIDPTRRVQCTTNTYFHQVPAVDVSVLGAAQDVGVFAGEAAVQLIALHLVSCIPERKHTQPFTLKAQRTAGLHPPTNRTEQT